MNIEITHGISGGSIAAIPAKADAHRAFIAAALSGQSVRIVLGSGEVSQDISATIRCLEQLGAKFSRLRNGVWSSTPAEVPKMPLLDCGESGSTLRFLLPVAAALGIPAKFSGSGRLPERPLADLLHAMKAHGVQFSNQKLPFSISGRLTGGRFELPGNVSSQYISGLLFALFAARESGEIRLTTALESSRYVEMTVSMLRRFGAEIMPVAGGWRIEGRHAVPPEQVTVEGDWSNAAAFLVAGALGGRVAVSGLNPESIQPDRVILDVLRRFGAKVEMAGNVVSVSPGIPVPGTVDVSESPDLLPVLAVLAANAPGESRFINAARLRLKESDRLHSTAGLLSSLGCPVRELNDALEITGGGRLSGAMVNSFNDHRIVMAAAAASGAGAVPLTIVNAEAINKSQPGFFRDFAALGGKYTEIQ